MSFKSGFESRERERERESQFDTAGGSEFQVRDAAVLNDRLANDVRRNGTHSSGTDKAEQSCKKRVKAEAHTVVDSGERSGGRSRPY